MAIDKNAVILIAPELSALTDDTFNALLADAKLEVNVDTFGLRYDLALKYLVAHKATLLSRRGAPAVSSQTVGPISVTYAAEAAPGGGGSALDATSYGQEYRRLLRAVAPRLAVL